MSSGNNAASAPAKHGRGRGDLFMLAAILGLPLIGALLGGRSLTELTRFPPPLNIPRDHVTFSWLAEGLVAVGLAMLAGPWLIVAKHARPKRTTPPRPAIGGRFPWWGVVAAAWTGLWWGLAWTRFSWFEPWQRFTFFPLWLGFIVSVNALADARSGGCLMRRSPSRWLGLFGASAGFWWVFEWLNRIVRNWHYLGVAEFGPTAYALHATLCFSTVLPAVAAVAEALDTSPAWRCRVSSGPCVSGLNRRGTGVILLVGGVAGLALTGRWPRLFYPALWVAPLALFLGRDACRKRGLAAEMARGDWSRAATWMVAAALCGLCWELWNWHSLARWIYTVPGVMRWRIFEMPVAGYAGYLPFGLECLYLTERLPGAGLPGAAGTGNAGE